MHLVLQRVCLFCQVYSHNKLQKNPLPFYGEGIVGKGTLDSRSANAQSITHRIGFADAQAEHDFRQGFLGFRFPTEGSAQGFVGLVGTFARSDRSRGDDAVGGGFAVFGGGCFHHG